MLGRRPAVARAASLLIGLFIAREEAQWLLGRRPAVARAASLLIGLCVAREEADGC